MTSEQRNGPCPCCETPEPCLSWLVHNMRAMADILARWPILAQVAPFAIEASGGLVVASARITHMCTLHLQVGPDGIHWAMLANGDRGKPELKRIHRRPEGSDMLAAIDAAIKLHPNQYPKDRP